MSQEEDKSRSWWSFDKALRLAPIIVAPGTAAVYALEQMLLDKNRSTPTPTTPVVVRASPTTVSTAGVPVASPPTPDIVSSKITIGGADFVDWFKHTFVASPKYPQPGGESERDAWEKYLFGVAIGKPAFADVWDRLEDLTGKKTVSLNEFVAHLMIMYNETGGLLESLSEGERGRWQAFGLDRYCFEPKAGASAYNVKPNRLAGDQLKARGILSEDADVVAWNSTTYPGQPSSVCTAARECDFYKFRGRGLNGLTWYPYYKTFAEAAVLKATGKDLDTLTDAELTAAFKKPEVYVPVYRNINTSKAGASAAMAAAIAGNFVRYGNAIAGGGSYATTRYAPRCMALRDAMAAAGYTVA